MAGRRQSRSPRLYVAGPSPAAAQIEVAARELRWEITAAGRADFIYVGRPPGPDELRQWAIEGAAIAVDLAVAADLGTDAYRDLVARAAGPVRLGEPLSTAPAIQIWLRLVGDTTGIDHLSGLARGEQLGAPLVAVALYAMRLMEWPLPLHIERRVEASNQVTLRLRPIGDTSPRHARLDTAPQAAAHPEWELQAAAPESVARIALLPTPRIEINGDEMPLPTAQPATAFGHVPFLNMWSDSVRQGQAGQPDADFLDQLLEAIRRLRE